MTKLFHRNSRTSYATAVGGDGIELIDAEGRRYIDASGGAAVSCLGHSNAAVRQAMHEQIDALAFAHTGFFSSDPAERLAERLIDLAPEGIGRVYLVSGGSEAVEASLKLARQYFVETGQPERRHIIGRRQSYHGNTLGALAVGGNALRRKPFEPLLAKMHHVSPCYAYREQRADETEQAYGERLAKELEAEILLLGPETVAAVIAEPVVGATLGAVPAVPGYFARIREVCDQYGVLLILDEVMCGMGRTGHFFACAAEPVRPDIVCIAKGLGAGYQPIGAMLCSDAIHDAIAAGSGSFQHGHTYLAHPVACAAAHAVLGEMVDRQLPEASARLGETLRAELNARLSDHPHVGDIRGRGLFMGVELVEDRATKMPFDPGLKLHAAIKAHALRAGLVCYPMGGTMDGRRGDHVLLAPPFVATESDLAEIARRLHQAIDAAIDAATDTAIDTATSDGRSERAEPAHRGAA
ncbi:MAG: aspartate aminotransferase family protein [Devosiaceae bacterium]|nr:aspartate aminotransferase family protein [Devosiaceae bacterium MH13]